MPYTYSGVIQKQQHLSQALQQPPTVTITDANGCTDDETASITEPAVLSATATATDASCRGGNDGQVTLVVTGGTMAYSYSWSNTETTQDITGLTAGTYTVTVTDANGCTTSDSDAVGQPAQLTGGTISPTN